MARTSLIYLLMLLSSSLVVVRGSTTYAEDFGGTSILVQAANAVVLTPTSFADTDVDLINLTLDPLTFGRIDPETGDLQGGQFLIFMALDLGTAPLRNLGGFIRDLQGNLSIPVNLDPSTPHFATLFSLFPSILSPNGLVVAFELRASPDLGAAIGAEGDMTLRIALVQSLHESLETAPGATLSIRYLLREQRPGLNLRGASSLCLAGLHSLCLLW